MTAFTFNSAPLSTLNSGIYYVFPVSALPLQTYSTVSQVASVPGFVPVTLTNRQLTATGLFFDDFEFPFFNYSTNVIGYVIAKQAGGSSQASDPLLCFSSFINSLGDDITTPPDEYTNRFSIDPVRGVLERIPAYRYTSGATYIPLPDQANYPRGTLYMIGTRNNTVVFANPSDGLRLSLYKADGSGNSNLGDRTFGGSGEPVNMLVDCRTGAIRVGSLMLRTNVGAINQVELYGSNSIAELSLTSAALISGAYANAANWTLISNGSVNIAGNNVWSRVDSVDQQTFWKYLKIKSAGTGDLVQGLEFLNSSYQSTKINMVP
jgi:hypothetical protein